MFGLSGVPVARRFLPLFMILGGVVALGMSPPAHAATAAEEYDAVLTVPSRLVISMQDTPIHSTWSTGPQVDMAEWTNGVTQSPNFGPSPMMIPDTSRLGLWTWVGHCNFMGGEGGCRANSPTTDVRLWSWGGVTATSRSGSKVSITTSSHRYAYSLNRLVPWRDVNGTIQYRNLGSTTWVNLKSVVPDATGHYTFTWTSSAVRDYRLVQAYTPMIWSHVSNIARR